MAFLFQENTFRTLSKPLFHLHYSQLKVKSSVNHLFNLIAMKTISFSLLEPQQFGDTSEFFLNPF